MPPQRAPGSPDDEREHGWWSSTRRPRGWRRLATGWSPCYRGPFFRIWDRDSNPKHPGLYEVLPGWVPPEREREADHWINFMNQEIRARLRESGQTPRDPEPSQGGIPPPLPRAPVPVPPLHTPLTPAQMFPAGLARQRQAGTLPDRTDPPSPPKPRRG